MFNYVQCQNVKPKYFFGLTELTLFKFKCQTGNNQVLNNILDQLNEGLFIKKNIFKKSSEMIKNRKYCEQRAYI